MPKKNPPTTPATPKKLALTPVETYHDPKSDCFERTALVIDLPSASQGGSVDIVTRDPRDGSLVRLCQINIGYGHTLPFPDDLDGAKTYDAESYLIVDVIDVDDAWSKRRAMVFGVSAGRRVLDVPKGGNLVSTDFRRPLAKSARKLPKEKA